MMADQLAAFLLFIRLLTIVRWYFGLRQWCIRARLDGLL
jgi:hypothetical protein